MVVPELSRRRGHATCRPPAAGAGSRLIARLPPVLWRLLYALVDLRIVIWLTASGLRALARTTGKPVDEGLLGRFERAFVTSGWPHQDRGWVNIHLSRFARRVRRSWTSS